MTGIVMQPYAILIAEDDEDDRFLLEELFLSSRVPFNITFVENGQELIKVLMNCEKIKNNCCFNILILLDLNMPVMDGREALWKIKQDPILKPIPIIVLTTSASDDDKEYCFELGVNDYMTKPNTFSGYIELLRKIYNILIN